MSIIFEKLKDLKKKSPGLDADRDRHAVPEKQIYTFKKMIFSPKGAMMILLLVTGLGCTSFFTLSLLKNYLDAGSKDAIVVSRTSHGAAMLPGDDPAMLPPEINDDPNAPMPLDPETGEPVEAPPKKEFKPPEYFLQMAKAVEDEPAEPDIPAEPGTVTVKIPRLKHGTDNTAVKSLYAGLGNTKTYDHLFPWQKKEQEKEGAGNTGNQLSEKKERPEPSKIVPPPFVPPINKPAGLENKTAKSPGRSDILKAAVTDKEIPASKGQEKIREEETRIKEQQRTASKIKTKKVSDLTDLSKKLKQAVDEKDEEGADRLMAQLFEQTDENSDYIMKLQAYKAIRENRYEDAKKWLTKVLEKDQTDFEAGINMAVVEIRLEEYEAAKRRLIRLKEMYPQKTVVDELLENY